MLNLSEDRSQYFADTRNFSKLAGADGVLSRSSNLRSSQSSVEELKDDLSAVNKVAVNEVVSSSGTVYLNN